MHRTYYINTWSLKKNMFCVFSRLKSSLQKLYSCHHELVDRCAISISQTEIDIFYFCVKFLFLLSPSRHLPYLTLSYTDRWFIKKREPLNSSHEPWITLFMCVFQSYSLQSEWYRFIWAANCLTTYIMF